MMRIQWGEPREEKAERMPKAKKGIRCTWTGSTNRTSLTKVPVKRQKAVTRGHTREETILEDKHMRKNIPALYNS
jgi:hypothetical protein